jgi:uncharacterized membrane protein YtjA (UPF0391 family)
MGLPRPRGAALRPDGAQVNRTGSWFMFAALRAAPREWSMLHYAVVFLVIALIAAVLGFTGIATGAATIAKILFIVFVILAVATFLFGRNRS